MYAAGANAAPGTVATANAAASTQGLPDVNPVYTWVRLAQRVPVRVTLDTIPDASMLVAGRTVTVRIEEDNRRNN